MVVPVHILRQAMELYLQTAYPAGVPGAVAQQVAPIQALAEGASVPLELLERDGLGVGSSYVIRLGQPMYPFMKIVVEGVPQASGGEERWKPRTSAGCRGYDFLLRVDTHDRHLHAVPGSPDAAWLATVRQSNKALGEKIEADWAAAGLPTFKEFLRQQLEGRKRKSGG